MVELVWLIPAFPLFGFLLLLSFGPRLGERSGWLASTMMFGSFCASAAVFAGLLDRPEEDRQYVQHLWEWISSGSFHASLDLLADPLSITMCMFITGVATLIHFYAIGYMHGDPKFSKFFLYLNLFAASMLVLVLGANLLVTFLGWEGVGVCSYLLISFWHTKPENAAAGKKAFVTNRIGDFGFMLASFLIFVTVGSIDYVSVNEAAHAGAIAAGTATAIALLLFVGAAGKSAQLPLYVWLPDAMAGPTPVSALIHAATMVTSGIYLLVRLSPLLHVAGWANDVIAWVGVITALFAATIAIAQNDIKKVLAYSTVSQLGFMFLAIGTGGYVAAMFHVVTHAFFKALLFLGSGSVIHGMAHEQDMRRMGGLRKFMPVTAGTFIIGWLAIAGVPPFAGFWSKDEILAGAWGHGGAGKVMWALGIITALLTAFYMTRQVAMTFFGPHRWQETSEASGEHDHADDHHGLTPDFVPHESPAIMVVPLVVLSVFAVGAGLMNLPFTDSTKHLEHWLEPVIAPGHQAMAASTLLVLAIVATVLAVVGILAGIAVYLKHRVDPRKIELSVFRNGWYYDATISAFVGGPGKASFSAVAEADSVLIDGVVNELGAAAIGSGTALAGTASGQTRRYAVVIGAGAAAVMAALILGVVL
jgi:NADH-quinone oxidoreductase subunit L